VTVYGGQRVLDQLVALPTVDSHSHTMLRSEYEALPERSLFTMGSYVERDFSGLIGKPAAEMYAGATSDTERWDRLKAVLRRTRNVSYWRHNVVTYQGIFGLQDDDLTDENWLGLNGRIKRDTAQPGWYEHVTRERCNLITQVRNVPWYEDWEPEYFTAILRMEPALQMHQAAVRQKLEGHLGRELGDLTALHAGIAAYLDQCVSRGAIGIKLGHAYGRTLYHERVDASTAAGIYARAIKGETLTPGEVAALQDHMVWFMTGLVAERNLVFQIHTGLQGNWGHIPDSNPLHLLNLIQAHRSVKFDLFHAGYPFAREIGVMGKHYANVYLNACWIYLITMGGSRQILSEWIDLVPAERLLGFGSDVRWPEMIYGHLVMARACIADVLAEKTEKDFLSKGAALDVARMLMQESPALLYGLDHCPPMSSDWTNGASPDARSSMT
jgi:uncharacterized protein